MKKGFALLASAVIGASLVLFSACGFVSGPVNNDGSISGNYRPATDIEILQVLHSIRQDTVFGDVDAQAWDFGLEYATDRLVALRRGDASWKDSSDAFYRLVLEREDTDDASADAATDDAETDGTQANELQMRGSGYGTSALTAPAGVYADEAVTLYQSFSASNDSEYVYRDDAERWQGVTAAAGESVGTRSPLAALVLDEASGELFGFPLRLMEEIVSLADGESADSEGADGALSSDAVRDGANRGSLGELLDGIFLSGMNLETWEDALQLRERLEGYGIALEVDLSSGIKLRLSASEETIRLVLAEKIADCVGDPDADIAELAESLPVRFVQCSYDIYFAVDADGVFSGIGVRADIEAVIEGVDYDLATGLPAEDVTAEQMRLTIRGMERLSAYGGDVTLPDDLDRYEDPSEAEDEVSGSETAGGSADGEAVVSPEEEEFILPTAEEFRADVDAAFGKLWKELYAAAQQGADAGDAVTE